MKDPICKHMISILYLYQCVVSCCIDAWNYDASAIGRKHSMRSTSNFFYFQRPFLQPSKMGASFFIQPISILTFFSAKSVIFLNCLAMGLLGSTLFRCFAIPISCLDMVLCYTLTGLIPKSQIVLRICITLFRGFAIPINRLGIVLCYILT